MKMKELLRGENAKRNVLLSVVLLFVCGAAYLNWSYTDRWGKADSAMARAEDAMTEKNEELYTAALAESKESDAYFAQARLTRQESRDAALSRLETAACAENASQEVIDSAMTEISVMASFSLLESQIENELLAKEFADCVVYLSTQGCTVAVPSPMEGLSEAAVARVTETVVQNSDYQPNQINIIEVKSY